MRTSFRLLLVATVAVCILLHTTSASGFSERAAALVADGYVQQAGLLHWEFVRGSETIAIPYEDKEINWSDEVIPASVREAVAARRSHGPHHHHKGDGKHHNGPQNGGDEFLDSIDSLGYWDFIPMQTGTLQPGSSISWPGICFESVTATMDADESGATVTFTATKKKELLCNELYWLGTRQKGYLAIVKDAGTTELTIDSWEQYQWEDVQNHGIHVYLFPGTWEDTLGSVLFTVSLFWDPNPFMVSENKKFFAENMQWAMMPRKINQVNVSASDIRSGDYLAILRMDGLDPMIAWGTGGRTGHTAMAMWFGDDLYVVESTDTEGLPQLVYWPPPYGIIRTPYEQWISQAMSANYHVALLPLEKEFSDRFDESAATNFFNKVEGMPYGWHNFMFTFLDTTANNLPRPITPDMFEDIIGFAERLIPIETESSIYNMLIMGYNHRLNSNCTDLHCIYEIIDPVPMSLSELTAIPEDDAWTYNGNYSMVCDVFVCEMWKAAGIFEDAINDMIECTEQTPKDTYQMAIFERDIRPTQCIEADYDLPYCQLMGTYQLTLPGFNSVALYPNMNDACPALPPVYSRTPGC